jgi:putative restriction endonuclease
MDDASIRLAAMHHCSQLLREHSGAVPWPAIQTGFTFEGTRIYLGSTPRGIHRPVQMARGVLSIKTTKPKLGGVSRYNDELRDDGYFVYAFQGSDPSNHDNTALLQSHEDGTPCIYFKAITPGLYQILFPCFIATWNATSLTCSISVGSAAEITRAAGPRVSEIERRYTTVEAKVRLHQAEFRELVLTAYQRRCAISGLPISDLLDAAHIIPDRDERGRAEISNGLCLSKLHHSAFDCHLLGIDPDGLIHVAEQVLQQSDGPTLEAIKGCHKRALRIPVHEEDRPRREYLAERFEMFKRAS